MRHAAKRWRLNALTNITSPTPTTFHCIVATDRSTSTPIPSTSTHNRTHAREVGLVETPSAYLAPRGAYFGLDIFARTLRLLLAGNRFARSTVAADDVDIQFYPYVLRDVL